MTPLKCHVKKKKLIIEVGLDVVVFATENHPELYDDDGEPRYSVIDQDEFVRHVLCELHKEEEDGSTPISRMLDAAILDAISNGAEGVEEREAGNGQD